jgi:hypothetical protein
VPRSESSTEQIIGDGAEVHSVGLVGDDYPGLRPLMLVEEGVRVKADQALFADRRLPDVLFTSPASGKITAACLLVVLACSRVRSWCQNLRDMNATWIAKSL